MRFITLMSIMLMLTFSCCSGDSSGNSQTDGPIITPEVTTDEYHDEALPLIWRLPSEWHGKWQVNSRPTRTFADVAYEIRDLFLVQQDQRRIPTVRLFVTRNGTGSLGNWLESVWPGVTRRFRLHPLEISKHTVGVALVQTASLRSTHPENFPFPDNIVLEDASHQWVAFPTLLSDHSALLEFGLSEFDFDARLWSGLGLGVDSPPAPQTMISDFGTACGRGYSEQFGVFRGVPMYSNGDCTGRGRGRYSALEFIRRTHPEITFDGPIEDLPSWVAIAGTAEVLLPHQAGIPQFRDILIFAGGREGHAAVVKHSYCFSPRVCRLVLIEQNWWGDDAGIGRIVVYSEIAGEIIAADTDSLSYPLRAIIRPLTREPERDNDGDGFAEADGDCDDTDPLIFPRMRESLLRIPARGAQDEIPVCNGRDDNCDGVTDEEFEPLLGNACDHPCGHKGVVVCDPSGWGRVCAVDPTTTTPEVRNGLDDDCDGLIDDGWAPIGTCTACNIDRDCMIGFRCMHLGGRTGYCLPSCAQGRPLCHHQFLCEADVAGMPEFPDWRCLPKNPDLCSEDP